MRVDLDLELVTVFGWSWLGSSTVGGGSAVPMAGSAAEINVTGYARSQLPSSPQL